MDNLANQLARHKGVPSTVIRIDTFQPFESRIGIDCVMRLAFDYDSVLVSHLKKILAAYKTDAVNPTLRRMTPGGWLSQHRCWFLEPCIWEAVRFELEFSGYRIQEAHP